MRLIRSTIWIKFRHQLINQPCQTLRTWISVHRFRDLHHRLPQPNPHQYSLEQCHQQQCQFLLLIDWRWLNPGRTVGPSWKKMEKYTKRATPPTPKRRIYKGVLIRMKKTAGLEEQLKKRLNFLMMCMRTISYKRTLHQMKVICLITLEMLIDPLCKYFNMNFKSNF